MAWQEVKESRQVTTFAGGASGERIYTGDIDDLMANQPAIGTLDHPYNTSLAVTSVTIQPELTRANPDGVSDSIPFGRMTVSYDFGSVGSWQTSKAYAGFREDEFTVGEGSMVLTTDANGEPFILYELLEKTRLVEGVQEKLYKKKSTTVNIKTPTAMWNIHVVLETVPMVNWFFASQHTNNDTFALIPPGMLLFDGFTASTIPSSSTVTGDPLQDVRLHFAFNFPGWNKNQFNNPVGEIVVVDGGADEVSDKIDYLVYDNASFNALFHML